MNFCKTAEHQLMSVGVQSRWPDVNVPYTFTALPAGITLDDAITAAAWAVKIWAGKSGLKPGYVEHAGDARILVGTRAIDGQYSILAETYLPSPGVRQVTMSFDTGDQWGATLPQALLTFIEDSYTAASRGAHPMPEALNEHGLLYALVFLHEFGHGVGLSHAPQNSLNVMAPIYNEKVLTLGTWDVPEIQGRYGKPSAVPLPIPPIIPVPVPPVTPTGGVMAGLLKLFQTVVALYNNPLFKQLVDTMISLFNAAQAGTLTGNELQQHTSAIRAELDRLDASADQAAQALTMAP